MEGKEGIISRISEIMERENLNQTKFAERIGMKQQNLSRVLTGKVNIGDAVINKVVLACSVDKQWLLTGNGSPRSDVTAKSIAANSVTVAPLISQYAYAGYLSGYGDPEYLEIQPIYYGKRKYTPGNYVAFEIHGDSMTDGTMRSITDGSLVLGRELYQHHWKSKLRKNEAFIIVHKFDGICLKEIINHDLDSGTITCHSWNPEYEDYEVNLDDVLQLFYVKEVTRSI